MSGSATACRTQPPRWLNISVKPLEEKSTRVPGINHFAWFLEIKWKGRNAYPLLRKAFENPALYSADDAHWAGADIVRLEVFKTFGYFLTAASSINAYYMPYFRRAAGGTLWKNTNWKPKGIRNVTPTVMSDPSRVGYRR